MGDPPKQNNPPHQGPKPPTGAPAKEKPPNTPPTTHPTGHNGGWRSSLGVFFFCGNRGAGVPAGGWVGGWGGFFYRSRGVRGGWLGEWSRLGALGEWVGRGGGGGLGGGVW